MMKNTGVKKKGQHTIWFKYAVTYLLVVSIPFFAFSAFFSMYINARRQQIVQVAMEETLAKLQADFDQRVSQMFAISTQLGKNRDFASLNRSQYSYESLSAICQTLLSYATTNTFYSDILFYQQSQNGIMFTTLGTCDASYYRIFRDTDGSPWKTLDEMEEGLLTQRWIPQSDVASGRMILPSALLYCQPVEKIPGGCLLFEIREESIRRLLPYLPDDSEVYIGMGETLLYPFGAQSMPGDLQPGALAQRMPDGRYQCARLSETTGLTYVYISAGSALDDVAKTAMSIFMVLTAVVSLACYLLVVLISQRHAQPLDRLITLTEDMPLGNEQGLTRVQTAVCQLQSRSQELYEMRRGAMRGHILIRLIRGKYRDEQDAQENLRRLDMAFSQSYRVIILLHTEPDWEERNVPQEITALLQKNHDVYGFSYAERSVFVLMLGMDEPDCQALSAELNTIAALPEFAECHLRFSLGGAFTAFASAQESFMQALSADRREQGLTVTLFQENDADELFYPREELQALGAALAHQDRSRISFLYDVLMNLVTKHSHIYFYTISLLSEMINLYLQAQQHSGENTYAEGLHSQHISDVDDMLNCLKRLHVRALQSMTESELSSTETEMTGIANYISACEELDTLNVGAVAERFGMNVSTLSHKFKEQMDCNISDYILTCKMNYACTLLRATDETVADIARRLGYSQYTSFVRTFKRIKGITPIAYREGWRQDNEVTK